MGFFDNPFGGLFDLNRDGHTDIFEAGLGFSIMQEALKETESVDSTDDLSLDSDLDSFERDSLQIELDELNDKLLELDLDEPMDYFSRAHERWEECRETVADRIQEIEDQLLGL